MSTLSADFHQRLKDFAEFKPGWDSYNAAPIAAGTLAAAQRLAERTTGILPEPFVAPCADGSVMLQWDLPGGAEAEVYVEPDGKPNGIVFIRSDDTITEESAETDDEVVVALERLKS